MTETTSPRSNSTAQTQEAKKSSTDESHHMDDEFEAINVEGQEKTGIWVHHPGKEVSQSWEPRKGRARRPETKLQCENNEGSDSPRSAESGSHLSESNDDKGKKVRRLSTIKRGINKIGSLFHSNSKDESFRRDGDEIDLPTPRANLQSVGDAGSTLRVIYDDSCDVNTGDQKPNKDSSSPEKDEADNTKKARVKGIAKKIINKPAHALKSVWSRKGSFSLNEEQVSGAEEKEASQGSDSDVMKDSAPAVGSPIGAGSPSVHCKESTEVKEGGIQLSPGRDAEKSASKVGNSGTIEKVPSSVQVKHHAAVEALSV